MTATVHQISPAQDRFEEFWQAYPRRVGKPLARAKFLQITGEGLKTRTLDKDSNTYVSIELRATPDELIDGAKRYYDRNRKHGAGEYGFVDDGKFLCHPSTWLNQGRWMDD